YTWFPLMNSPFTALRGSSTATLGDLLASECLRNRPDIAAAAVDLMWRAGQSSTSAAFLSQNLPLVLALAGAEYVGVAVIEGGARPALVAGFGPPHNLPWGLIAEVVDRESPLADGPWTAAPLSAHAATGEVALFYTSHEPASQDAGSTIPALALMLGAALGTARQREHDVRRAQRLEAILNIASSWNQTGEMEPLLVQMAEAATRLLEADRASIFLWDRPHHMLVGRPALGVKGGELRIPDDSGIVGEVVASGEPRRTTTADPAPINRQVDRELGYQTRNLVCVPLRATGGELLGAFEVLNKAAGDFSADDQQALIELAAHAAVALENTQQFEQLLSRHRHIVDQAAEGVQLIGHSPAIEALRSTIRRVADTELAILITGENGTGKEVVSQSIHYLSRRRSEPFIAVNCAAITETLLESELFGHEKGAFTDAHESRQGKFELASGGTLFLDEIGDLSLSGQAKMLRVLEEKIVVRVGGSKPIHTDARVIAATNQNLGEMVRAKRFRQDLYFRLNVVTLELPPLRERGDDVILLAEHFLADFCRKAHRKTLKFSAAARSRLESHAWPGNIRELRNLMERLAYLSTSDRIEADDLAFILAPGGETSNVLATNLPLAEATDKFQIEYITSHIERVGGNMSEAAKRMGLHRSNLYRKMRQLGMHADEV
ncbi:MAG TPA: sigma-54-dependent Fis family transcriptional regulator, partial [Pirellulales bacterium]|nr:sigma-54-dependent Fis family transcriptional regulator [Pirellulales bacterium]